MPKGVYDHSNHPGNRHPVSSVKKNLSKDTRREDIARIVGESYQYFDREVPKTNEEFAERLNDYFKQCNETGQLPTVEDMCLALGAWNDLVNQWEKANTPRALMIKKAKQIIASSDAKLAVEGRIPQVVYIFRAKNYYGMKDQQDVVITPTATEQVSAADIREKYLGEQVQQKISQKGQKAQKDVIDVTETVKESD